MSNRKQPKPLDFYSRLTYSVTMQTTKVAEEDRIDLLDTQRLPTTFADNLVLQPMEKHILTPEIWSDLEDCTLNITIFR